MNNQIIDFQKELQELEQRQLINNRHINLLNIKTVLEALRINISQLTGLESLRTSYRAYNTIDFNLEQTINSIDLEIAYLQNQ